LGAWMLQVCALVAHFKCVGRGYRE
jgi:hypothetical protein